MSGPSPAFKGEDESAGVASPALDLVAAAVLLAIGLFFASLSLALPVPGSWLSAPGLLPFIVSSTLSVMAVLLGLSAIRRGRDIGFAISFWMSQDAARRIVLIGGLFVYIGALDLLELEGFVQIAGRSVAIGSFEPVTVLFLTALLRVFWTDRLWHCVLVAFGWTILLTLAFRYLFHIPLPG